jgi:deazaflavin-dependent oxidoreductase (nitroreductase family)
MTVEFLRKFLFMFLPKFMIRFFSQIHAAAYRRSNGQRRNRMNGLPVLLLTTTGQHTGKPHTVPVVYITHGDAYLIAPGVVPRPDWYLNLKNKPQAEIQVGGRTIPITAEELSGPERARLWASVPEYWKAYEQRAGITLPLMRLSETKS